MSAIEVVALIGLAGVAPFAIYAGILFLWMWDPPRETRHPEATTAPDTPCDPLSSYQAAMRANAAVAYVWAAVGCARLVVHQNLFMAQPSRTLPAGIFWDRTGGKSHRVTIRREPEIVIDLSGLGRPGNSTIAD